MPRLTAIACVEDATSSEAARLVGGWEHASTPAIVFTGYVPPCTSAERLTQSGRARYLRWNVHPTLSDNAQLVRKVRAETVIPAFGDAKHIDAWRAAFAPSNVILETPVVL